MSLSGFEKLAGFRYLEYNLSPFPNNFNILPYLWRYVARENKAVYTRDRTV
jgi:hypothetical protein